MSALVRYSHPFFGHYDPVSIFANGYPDTRDKPFACDCGQSFTRQDLLARHVKLSHASRPVPQQGDSQRLSTPSTGTDGGIVGMANTDMDLFWDPGEFMVQDTLETMLLDPNFSSFVNPAPRLGSSSQTESFTKFSSRLPALGETGDIGQEEGIHDGQPTAVDGTSRESWYISEPAYRKICDEVQSISHLLTPSLTIPSRDTLMRYLEIYLVCASKFLPFIHPRTFSADHRQVELTLAATATGSLYRFDRIKSYELYFMSKELLMERIRRRYSQHAASLLGQGAPPTGSGPELGIVQTLILLISFASWADKTVALDAVSMTSQLAALLRQCGISDSDEMAPDIDWVHWIAVEEKRRTIFAAYTLFGLHSIAFDAPPLIFNREIGVCLPGCLEQWNAKTAEDWQRSARPAERHFQEMLHLHFDGTGVPQGEVLSSFANYLLMHGILQHIYLGRHAALSASQSLHDRGSIESALQIWQASWETTWESTLDPLSDKGPFGLTATALLRLAYIRLNTDVGPRRGLLERDLDTMIRTKSKLQRSLHIDRTILHAAHALSIPVRLGVSYMSSSVNPIWTIEHSICSLECALLLKDWLETIAAVTRSAGAEEGLRKGEKKLLDIVVDIIKETDFSATLNIMEDEASRYQRMAATVIKIWAQIFQGTHVLEIDDAIGASFQLLDKLLITMIAN
ncbi:uncharacterized protein E0L32_012430 [Thyridium curvatum]|uniref:C2H2-type domain-containing protein n=1 Tax=Thyridium curvatum TaxID=1093900 RepID=A0A507B1S7_9PEZI|nr:uncharacterized protein E0L32_012430 [Thyridium curvatum]TPX16232.1 hypothetical protein E0L32_012430 [Thyridium curvatum]